MRLRCLMARSSFFATIWGETWMDMEMVVGSEFSLFVYTSYRLNPGRLCQSRLDVSGSLGADLVVFFYRREANFPLLTVVFIVLHVATSLHLTTCPPCLRPKPSLCKLTRPSLGAEEGQTALWGVQCTGSAHKFLVLVSLQPLPPVPQHGSRGIPISDPSLCHHRRPASVLGGTRAPSNRGCMGECRHHSRY
jgi:hypothetical protein